MIMTQVRRQTPSACQLRAVLVEDGPQAVADTACSKELQTRPMQSLAGRTAKLVRPQAGSGGWACAVLLFVLTYRRVSRHCNIVTLLRRDLRPPALDPDGDIEVRTLKLLARRKC